MGSPLWGSGVVGRLPLWSRQDDIICAIGGKPYRATLADGKEMRVRVHMLTVGGSGIHA